MRSLFSMTVWACLLFAVNACSSELEPGQEDFEIHGVTIQIEDHGEEQLRILVEYAANPPNDGTGKVWLILHSETEILRQRGRSLQRVSCEALDVGQDVRAWTSNVWLYTNPPQAGARRVVIDRE